ncbi:hypothetical protein TRFO_02222 [Tritrichomonas foetus]|uniref:Uncharacterized protein n=1 Tax=Tritrichomonas foetus TaxID=1144522 RepID=A0A1J4J7P0_9EUKA|nr:hypothetical protein TRFO_02222 [Tritrichomonas foetus]|eukprot:OHS95242.1 hypothetical protein TRFO_02222 [Tritrichomonas foetus]
MEKEKSPTSQFPKTPTTLELRVMHFIEYSYLSVRKHPVANGIVTTIFMLYLYLNSIVTLIVQEDKTKLNPTLIDAFCFIISLTVAQPNNEEIRLGLFFIYSLVFFVFLISVITFAISYSNRYVIQSAFTFLILYLLPTIFTLAINVFQQGYISVDKDGWFAANYVSVFAHSVFTFLVTMTSLFAFISPYICSHPFFMRSLLSGFITLLYYLVIVHIDSYFYSKNDATNIIRLALSITVAIYVLINPPFYTRNITAIFFSYLIFIICVSISILIQPEMHIKCVYYILIGIFVSVVIYYIIYPFVVRRSYPRKIIFYEFFLGNERKVIRLLQNLDDPSEIEPSILLNVILIAFHLNSPSLTSLLSYYLSSRKLTFVEMLHLWLITHLYNNAHGNTTTVAKSIRSGIEDRILKLEKEFWTTAWLSDIANLPIIAGYLGRKNMSRYLITQHTNSIYRVLFPDARQENSFFYSNELINDFFHNENENNEFNNNDQSDDENDPNLFESDYEDSNHDIQLKDLDHNGKASNDYQVKLNNQLNNQPNNKSYQMNNQINLNDRRNYRKGHLYNNYQERRKISVLTKLKKYLNLNEILLVIAFLFFVAFLIISLFYLLKQRRQGTAYEDFLSFTYEFLDFHLQDRLGDPSELYQRYRKAVTTELPKIHKYYIDSGFSKSFENYYDQLTNSDAFPYEVFFSFIKIYDQTLQNFTNVFEMVVEEKQIILDNTSTSFYCIFSIISFLLFVLSLIKLRKNMIQSYQKFRFIPKQKIIEIGKIKPQLNQFDKYWIDKNFNVFKSYPLTILINFIYLPLFVLLISAVVDASQFNTRYLQNARLEVLINANAQRIPVNLVAAVYQDTDEFINTAQFYANDFLSDPNLHDLIIQFPQSFYNLIGNVMFDPTVDFTITATKTREVVKQIIDITTKENKVVPYHTVFHYQRVFTYSLTFLIACITIQMIIFRIKPIMYSEQKTGEYLFNRITHSSYHENNTIHKGRQNVDQLNFHMSSDLNNNLGNKNNQSNSNNSTINEFIDIDNHDNLEELSNDSHSNSTDQKEIYHFDENKDKWEIDDIPIIILALDEKFKVKYQTNLAKQTLGLKVGDSFRKAEIERSSKNDILRNFKMFKKTKSQPVSIPFNKNEQSLILSPFYKNEQILDHVLVVVSNDPPNASVETFNKLNRLFYSIYPRFLPLNQTFPCEIQSNGRPFFLLFFKLIGFNEWCDKADINIVDKFRKDVSAGCDALLQDEVNFCRVRESSDFIIMMMNRETKLSIWKILDVCSDFGNNVLNMIQKLTTEYDANEIHGCVLLFKVREPNYYFTDKKCGRTDFKSDAIFAGEARFVNCKPEIVNYSSQKKELKVSNTTKLKTCRTPSGEEYELLIVV